MHNNLKTNQKGKSISMGKPEDRIKNEQLIKSVTGASPEVSITPQPCVSRSMNLTTRNQHEQKILLNRHLQASSADLGNHLSPSL